jgi:hypothetical protein
MTKHRSVSFGKEEAEALNPMQDFTQARPAALPADQVRAADKSRIPEPVLPPVSHIDRKKATPLRIVLVILDSVIVAAPGLSDDLETGERDCRNQDSGAGSTGILGPTLQNF